MRQPNCGCIVERHESGPLRSVVKCARHRRLARDPATLGEAYYRELGVLGETRHLEEIREALGPFPAASGNRCALEIGCGASPYAGAIKAAGWAYMGLDESPWAVEWTAKRWDVAAMRADWGLFLDHKPHVGLILAAHVLEHFEDAPAALAKMATTLEPGGELWLIVPDDSDLMNPDHLYFFDVNTLKCCVESTGLIVQGLQVRQQVQHEKFIYARAKKPGPLSSS